MLFIVSELIAGSETNNSVKAVASEIKVTVSSVEKSDDTVGSGQFFCGDIIIGLPSKVDVVIVLKVLLPDDVVLCKLFGAEFEL